MELRGGLTHVGENGATAGIDTAAADKMYLLYILYIGYATPWHRVNQKKISQRITYGYSSAFWRTPRFPAYSAPHCGVPPSGCGVPSSLPHHENASPFFYLHVELKSPTARPKRLFKVTAKNKCSLWTMTLIIIFFYIGKASAGGNMGIHTSREIEISNTPPVAPYAPTPYIRVFCSLTKLGLTVSPSRPKDYFVVSLLKHAIMTHARCLWYSMRQCFPGRCVQATCLPVLKRCV